MSDLTRDLTRWNRAGLPRFRYVDGNAATWLEELRLALLSRNLAPLLDPNQPDPAARLDWWEKIWRTPPADPPGQAFVKQVLDAAEARLLWQAPDGSGPLWVRPPVRPELETEWSTRLREQYEAGRGDLAWEIVRSFARGAHLLTEHLDAYANEGYLGTATQWENVRRLIAMLDVRPAPPASASTVLVLEAKAPGIGSVGTAGTVAKGFQIKHSPQDGGAPVIFETLEDLEVDPALNALRPLDHDRNPDALQGSRIELEGRVKGLKAGEPLVLEDERSGDLHAYLIQSVSEGETVTRVEVSPAVKSGVPKGWARVHAAPRERLAPLAPASRGAEVGKSLHLAEEPAGLQPGDVVWISDGHQPVYRRVEQVRGRRLILDAGLGELRTDLTVVGRPIVLPVTDMGRREVNRDNSGSLEVSILAIRVAGDWTRLANEWLADKKVSGSGKEPLPLFQVISADYRPVGSVIGNEGQLDPNGGYTVLRLQWTHQSNLANPQALLAPPPGGGLWRADRFLEKASGKLPAEITSALPKKAAAGDVAVVASGSTLAWTRLAAIEADADAGTALLRANDDGWQDRGGGPFFLAETRVFTKFERSARVVGWSANATPLSGTEVPLPAEVLSASAALRPGRTVVVELDGQPTPATPAMTARVISAAAGKLTLDRALPADARYDNLVLRANAVLAGHGEARDERALGSGDASQSHQTFRFEETGVSFVADPGQPSGVRAAIEVRIGNRLWQQVPTLADSGPADPHYTVRMTEDGGVELAFGDGRNGRRLPTGVNNVRLAWRSGTGLAGNLPAGRLVKAARPNPLIEAVRQPLPATGGNDMEGVESMRATAPASVSTLGRAVSLADYGRLAASQSSVWQAAAFALPTGLARKDSVRVVVVPAGGGQLGALAGQVRAFLEAHALPGVSVRVDPYTSVGFNLRVELQIVTAEFDPERVADTVRARLLAAFGLRARKLGQALRLSEIYRIVEGVPGVANSLCILDNDPKKARVDAPADGVVHLDASTSSLTIHYREFEL